MNTHTDKIQESKSQLVSNVGTKKQVGFESTFQFVDNRPEAIAQRKMQEMVNNSPQARQSAQLQAMIDNNSTKHQQLIQNKENKTGLPDNLKSGMESLSGLSLDDVKVYRNSDKPAQLQAHAYAQGTDIHIGQGQEKHLPHEAWHVVQQKQGRVKPTMQMKGTVNINDDIGLEKEADVMGEKAMQMKHNTNSAAPTFFKNYKNSNEIDREVSQLKSIMNATVLQFGGGNDGEKASDLANQIASGAVDVNDSALELSEDQRRTLEGLVAMLRQLEEIQASLVEFERLQEALLPEPMSLEDFLAQADVPKDVSVEDMKRTHHALKDEKWKEMVRRQHHGKGPTAYDNDKNFGSKLKKGESYTKSWTDADDFVHENLGSRLTLAQLETTHDLISQHLGKIRWRNEKSGGGYNGAINIELNPQHASKQGIAELHEDPNMGYSGESQAQELSSGYMQEGKHAIRTKSKTEEEVKAAAQKIIDEYYVKIGKATTQDERLLIIAEAIQNIGRLHAFEDANTRTNMLILNKFLLENGFTPSLVNDPKDYYLKSVVEWEAEIRGGMAAWEVIARKKGWLPKAEAPATESESAKKSGKASKQREPRPGDQYSESIRVGDSIREFNLQAIQEEAEALLAQEKTPEQVHRELHDNSHLPHEIIERVMLELGYEHYL